MITYFALPPPFLSVVHEYSCMRTHLQPKTDSPFCWPYSLAHSRFRIVNAAKTAQGFPLVAAAPDGSLEHVAARFRHSADESGRDTANPMGQDH